MNLKNQTADLEAKTTLRKLIWLMEVLTDYERYTILSEMERKYCRNCGKPMPCPDSD